MTTREDDMNSKPLQVEAEVRQESLPNIVVMIVIIKIKVERHLNEDIEVGAEVGAEVENSIEIIKTIELIIDRY